MSGEQFLFWLLALTTCGGAIAVVVNQNVVRMAFWLVVSLGSVAAIYFLLHADFVGATQLMIYVGGTVVLLIFGVMLTASGPHVNIKTSPADLVMAGGVGVLMLFLLISTVTSVDWEVAYNKLDSPAAEEVQVAGGDEERGDVRVEVDDQAVADDHVAADDEENGGIHPEYPRKLRPGYNDPRITQGNTARPIGLKLLGVSLEDIGKDPGELSAGYLLPFEIVSVHLLVVLIGAGYLARAKRRVGAKTDAESSP
jgi:NADH:ubiquinone oxidoreductase subunit 6 (subunit J)